MSNIEKNIRVAMAQARIRSVAELAKRTCIPYTTLQRKMNHPEQMTVRDLQIISKDLHKPISALLGE